jgi:hypothetical protein
MIDFVTKSVDSRMVTAFFDTREAAQNAADSLKALGVRFGQIQIAEGSDPQKTAATAEPSFWESLKSMFLPEEDHHSYAEGLRRDGFLLSANVVPELYDRALEVVDSGGAVNMDEREENWRSSRWTGYQPDPTVATGTAVGAAEGMAFQPTPVPAEADGGLASYDSTRFARDMSHGRKGLRSYAYSAGSDERPDNRFSANSGRITEHMQVIASDGVTIGKVDHVEGNTIKLAKTTSPDGQHHYVALTSVDHVDTHVHLNRGSREVQASW